MWRCAGELAFGAAAGAWAGCLLVHCLRGGIGGVFGERVGGSCRGRGWRICRIGEGWVGIVVVGVRIGAVAVAALAVEACRSAVGSSAAVAFVFGAYQFVVEPFAFARKDSESRSEGTSACSAVAVCWLEAYSPVVAAAPVLAVVH